MANIYVIHYPKLLERKKYIQFLIDKSLLNNVTWISKHNKDYEESFIDSFPIYIADEQTWQHKCQKYYEEIPPFRLLQPGDICCALNHIYAWQKIADNGDGLIVEDDAIFCDDFEEIFDNIIRELPSDCDVLFAGGGYYHEKVAKTISTIGNFYKKSHPSTNTLCGYFLKQNTAVKLLKMITSYTLPIDFETNYLFDNLNLNVYHHIPYVIKEGTILGLYGTSQQR